MKESNEDICKRSELIYSENEVLSENIKALESSMGVLQGEKDEVEDRLSDSVVENEEIVSRISSWSEKMQTIEEERNDLMNEKETINTKVIELQTSMEEMTSKYEEMCKSTEHISTTRAFPSLGGPSLGRIT